MIRETAALLAEVRRIHGQIRDAVVATTEEASEEQLSRVASEDAGGDTIFAIDRVSEATLLTLFQGLAASRSLVLIAEGLAGDTVTLPFGVTPEQAELRVIVDPIDGTRGLMYQKRSAWILSGVAPNRGAATTLADIEIAVQTEIPLRKQHLSDQWWALAPLAGRAGAVGGERFNRLTGVGLPLSPAPSRATTIAQGYGGVARFFPGARAELAALDDAVVERILGPVRAGKAHAFEDQYICTGGQLAELMTGHDRWLADLRPLVEPLLRRRGQALGLCCHPYDLCTELIARQAGVIVGDERSAPLRAPLDLTSDLCWTGYANAAIRDQVAPALEAALRERGLLG